MEDLKLYYTIGEVAEMLSMTTSQIRHWEKEIHLLRPKKRRNGNRVYTKDDIELIKHINYLVKEKGYTLHGANRALLSENVKQINRFELIENLKEIKAFLEGLRGEG